MSERGAANPPAVIHVDLDGAKHIFANSGWRFRGEDDPLFASGMRGLLAFLARHGLKATLFVIAEDVENPVKRSWLEEAVRQGHEIASHSLTHPRLCELPAERKRTEIIESKRLLESALGVRVTGFRAPSYSIDRECLELLAEGGYEWDSSTFPDAEFATRLAVASIAQEPHRALGDGGVWELPLPRYKPAPFPFHPCYAFILGRTYFRWRLRAFRRAGKPLVWLLHLTDLADPLPADRLCGWKSKLLTLSHLSAETKARRCAVMLGELRRRYRVTTTGELLEEQH